MKTYKIKCYGCRKIYKSKNPPPEEPSDCICQDCGVWLSETVANVEMREREQNEYIRN